MGRVNTWGLAMIVAGGLTAGLASFALKLPDAVALMAVGAVLLGLDLAVRLRARYQTRWLFNRQAGGDFIYVPVWVIGLAVLAANTIRAFMA